MRSGLEVRLETVIADRNSLQKHVWRAEIVLLTADGLGTNEIMRRTGKSKPCVWRWQERFMTDGVDGLLRDKTRPPGKAPIPDAVVAAIIEKTLHETPPEATHWTVRDMAKVIQHRPENLARSWPGAASHPSVQTLQRCRLRRQAAGRGRTICQPAGSRGGAVDG